MSDKNITEYLSVVLENKCNDCSVIKPEILKHKPYDNKLLDDYIVVCEYRDTCKYLEKKFKRVSDKGNK